ncbi:MAG: efflux RND transporter periplasmic adaptor subunit [Gammaproteobacteria bacterium]
MNSRVILVLLAVAAAAGTTGWWVAGHRLTHTHTLVEAVDAQGRVYYTCPMHPQVRQATPGTCPICGMKLVRREGGSGQTAAPASDKRTVLYWYDPMKPEVHFDKPGKSPFMDMALVPKYADAGGATVEIDPRMVQNLGMRTAVVATIRAAARVDTAGTVAIDERRIVAVEPRVAGWVEHLAVRAVGDTVRRGDTLALIYAPDLLAAQEELALATKLGDRSLIDAARTRLDLLGAHAVGASPPQRRVPVLAPISGVVTELMVREGAQIAPGTPLMKLADLASVWVQAEVPEALAFGVTAGAPAQARLEAQPGRVREGTVDYVYPTLDARTRSVRARLAFANPDGALKPGMYAQVSILGVQTAQRTTVPAEAVIRTGTRAVVIVAEAKGRFRPVHVVPGRELAGQTEIIEGLRPGQRVVVSGQFLIDSEASLQGAYDRMADDSPAGRMRLMGEHPGPGAYEQAGDATELAP